MEYAMNQPWWLGMTDDDGRERGRDGRRGKRRGRGERPDDEGRPRGRRWGFGPQANMGHEGPEGHGRRPGGFGPGGPGGPGGHGPMGPGGPGGFGPGGPGGPGGFGPGEHGPMGPGGPGRGGRGRGRGRGGRARRGDVRQAILALLTEQPMNGYQIITTLAERTQGLWKPSPGAVYPALAQLVDEGLITETEVDGQRAFTLTEAGREPAENADKPWEAVNAEAQAAEAAFDPTAWQAYQTLATAVQAVSQTGTPEQVARAASALGEAEKAIYRLLGEPEDAPTE
ncbi:PadR family transcriptional regulator [Propioniciclava soli]|uniref:PadR family transcriptional regulator n=1 Tax=Propioniciclava soli TaxID=2775081 RepID=A0ABZ3C464_9ACTN|nr:PadR family transcriptional regulator [Propioniciclava soli]